MSQTSKIVLGVVVVIIVVLGGWMIVSHNSSSTMSMQDGSTMNMNQMQSGQMQTGTQSAAPATDGAQVTSPTDTSDAALDKDTSNIDAQLNGLNSDSNNATPGSDAQ